MLPEHCFGELIPVEIWEWSSYCKSVNLSTAILFNSNIKRYLQALFKTHMYSILSVPINMPINAASLFLLP